MVQPQLISCLAAGSSFCLDFPKTVARCLLASCHLLQEEVYPSCVVHQLKLTQVFVMALDLQILGTELLPKLPRVSFMLLEDNWV